MVFFPNKTAELYEYNEATEVNPYGEPIATYTLVGTYPCDFQIKSSSDTETEHGEIRTDTYKAYFDINVPLTDTMIIRFTGEPDTYEIIGSVIVNDHGLINHKKIELIKQRQPTELTNNNDDGVNDG